jgi:quinoprotein dehydrogenase-associated probable ABC transporter substrate-binding protein
VTAGLPLPQEPPAEGCAAPTTLVPLQPAAPGQPPRPVLRISADPNNLPFTNDRREGFENKIAELLARELGMDLQDTWRAQRRGFFRMALKEGECDLVLGVPADFERALTTVPYYRSSYVFVARKDRGLAIKSLDDPSLRALRIGVQMIGSDGTNTPPAHTLARRGIIDNVVGYTVYGDYREESPPARIVKAVADGAVDVAVVWGPLAGYFAKRQGAAELPLTPAVDPPGLTLVFDIAMGVRKGNKELRDRLNAALKKQREAIDEILDGYGVPRVAPPG